MTAKQINAVFYALNSAMLITHSAVLALALILVFGWPLAIGLWLASGYLGGCMMCGLALIAPKGAETIASVEPAYCDAQPVWAIMTLGPMMLFRWLMVVVATFSASGRRARYFAWYKRESIKAKLRHVRAEMKPTYQS
jgi:hypothetical protein